VDLRYDRQIIVNPDLAGAAKQPPITAAAAKAAISAGVKPAALVRVTPKKWMPHTFVHPAVVKHSERVSRWQKHAVAPKKTHAGPAVPPKRIKAVTLVAPKRPSSARPVAQKAIPQKPSPAILKGQESR
jgi:hypothetical protein